jgi:hypothetical protein
MKAWQERVAIHHIDGDPRNNDVANLKLVHAKTREPLSDRELEEYERWARRLINE